MNLSALILTKNEEDMIEDCLKQLGFVDEIIVLDENSSDNTVEMAKKYTDKILRSTSEDFSRNRTILAQNARFPWLLYIDADERITDELISEIKRAVKVDKYGAYYFPRRNYVLGKLVKHGGWWPDYVPRLFQKNNLIGWHSKVHESPNIKGKFGYFKAPLVHLSARNLNYMLEKSIKWAKIEAELFYSSRSSYVNVIRLISAFCKEFVRRYFVKRGFLDGTIGLVEAIYQGLHQAIIQTYLWEIQMQIGKRLLQAKRGVSSK